MEFSKMHQSYVKVTRMCRCIPRISILIGLVTEFSRQMSLLRINAKSLTISYGEQNICFVLILIFLSLFLLISVNADITWVYTVPKTLIDDINYLDHDNLDFR